MITVLMAVWQGERYLSEQLDSIMNQTREVDLVVIADDGSTDQSVAIIKKYQKLYPRRIVMLEARDQTAAEPDRDYPKMSGAAANFFYLMSDALSRIESDYWFLSDQDDVWLPDKVEKMCNRMTEAEQRVGTETPILLYSDVKVVDEQKKVLSESLFKYQQMDPERSEFAEVLVENPVTGGAAMFNRSLLNLVGSGPSFCVMHDWWMALVASCFGEIICLPEALSLYRQHDHNTLGASKTGSVEEIRRRLSREQEVQANYGKMFAQAECFLKQYGSQMAVDKREALRGYLSLCYRSPLRRFSVIRRYSLYKTSLLQTIAQCVTIRRRGRGI